MNAYRQQYLPLGIVILLTLVLMKLPGRTAAQFKLAVSGLFLPLFGLTASAQDLAAQGMDAMVPRSELTRQIQTLRRENDQLRIQLAQTAGVYAENDRLRHTLSLTNRTRLKLKLAQVVGRDPANWWRTVRIDAGLRDGILTNAPVLTPEGLVGRISQVGYSQSEVVLLGDPDCRVGAFIEETGDHGVIAPDSASPLDNVIVDLNYLSHTSRLRAGQRVVTSGLGGVFPKHVCIGHIVDFRSVDFGLYTGARVRVAAQLNALQEVWVMLPLTAMNWLNTILLLLATFLAVFFQCTFTTFRNVAGTQPDLLPGLIVYISLSAGLLDLTLVAIAGGLWFDSLSANPIGVSCLPLFLIGFALRHYRGLILRRHLQAQWLLGAAASAAAPLLTLLLVLAAGASPLLGWFSLWQWFVMTLIGAALTPVWFQVMDRLSNALSYQRIEPSSFRPDREIKRGRY